MKKEDLEKYADQYCINNFGAKTGNKSVRDAFIDGYNLAVSILDKHKKKSNIIAK